MLQIGNHHQYPPLRIDSYLSWQLKIYYRQNNLPIIRNDFAECNHFIGFRRQRAESHRLVLPFHKSFAALDRALITCAQHGHRGSFCAKACAIRRRSVAIEWVTWRSDRTGATREGGIHQEAPAH